MDYNILSELSAVAVDTVSLSEPFCSPVHGSVFHITEDGTETHLTTPGTTLIQRGTSHAWENRGTEWVRWMSVLIDADPVFLPDSEGKVVLASEFMTPGWEPPSKETSSKM